MAKNWLGIVNRYWMGMSNILKGVLYFGVLAPPIGSVAFTFGMAVTLVFSGHSAEIIYLVPGAFSFALFSYIFGGVPALATGAIAGWFRHSLNSKGNYIAVGILAGVLCFAFGAMTRLHTFEWPEIRTLLLLFVAPGIFGGALTAALFGARRKGRVSE